MVDFPVSQDEVRALLAEDYPSSRGVSPFIATADLVVQESLTGKGMTPTRLYQIELYLAAHFAYMSLNRGMLTGQKVGETEERYSANLNQGVAQGYLSTTFGQTAIGLDTSGTLAAMGVKGKAEFKVINVDRSYPSGLDC